MKKILFTLLCISVLIACNNDDKAKTETKTESEKVDAKETVVTPSDNPAGTSEETSLPAEGWTAAQRSQFVTDCITAAMGGMDRARATSYCECMQPKIEGKYGTFAKANMMTEAELQSEEWMAEVRKCLGQR